MMDHAKSRDSSHKSVTLEFKLSNSGLANLIKMSYSTLINYDLGSALLEDTKGANNRVRHSFTLTPNLEILQRSLRLSAPQSVNTHTHTFKTLTFRHLA